jgi:ParB/RepB/Spo0J family partition protein
MGDVGEETTAPEQGRKARRAPIENLRANPRNPRRAFSDTELNELADSIRERGIIQPIVVRSVRGEPDNFEIIAGERRWRAAQRAGLHEVPVAVVEATDAQALEFAIIENVQRADLNAIEEATGYLKLMEEFNHSQDEVAQIVGRSRCRRWSRPASCRPGTRACWSGSRTRSNSRKTSSSAGSTCAKSRRRCARTAARSRAMWPAPRAPRTPIPRRWSGGCRMLWDWT